MQNQERGKLDQEVVVTEAMIDAGCGYLLSQSDLYDTPSPQIAEEIFRVMYQAQIGS
jgi:hypothetical protein